MYNEDSEPKTFSENLQNLIQYALDKKNSADDSDVARRWAIVRTELEKVLGYVNNFLED
jgi:hypothetical protein